MDGKSSLQRGLQALKVPLISSKSYPTILLCIFLLYGCANGTNISDLYHYRFMMMQPPTGGLDFEDDTVRFSFQPNRERVNFIMENKGPDAVALNWDAVEFEDRHGATHKVVSNEAKSEEKDKPKGTTIIKPGQKLEAWVLPADNAKWGKDEWKIKKPIFPELKTGFDVDTWDRTTFRLVFPLKIGEEQRYYRFGFRVRVD